MTTIKQRLALFGAATAVGIGTIGSFGIAHAQSNYNHDSLVDKLATRFNINKDEVQKVFDEEHEARKAERMAKADERIAQAVTDGKLTQDQADKLKAKQKELEAFRESLKDKSEEERHTAMKQQMDEFKKWLDDNKIDLEGIMPFGGHGHGGGMRGKHAH